MRGVEIQDFFPLYQSHPISALLILLFKISVRVYHKNYVRKVFSNIYIAVPWQPQGIGSRNSLEYQNPWILKCLI
jgi:hypothetical protein